jgi:hypothetical protein
LIAMRGAYDMFCPHQLECPLGDSPFSLGVLDDIPEWVFGHHGEGVCVKVVSELALGH